MKFLSNMKISSFFNSTVAAFLMKILAAFSGLLLNVVLARSLGAVGTGLYYLVLSCASVAIMLGQFGLGQAFLKFVAVFSSNRDWVALKGVTRLCIRICFFCSVLVTGIFYWVAPFLSENIFDNVAITELLRWIGLAIFPGALLVLFGYGLQGLQKIKESIFITSVCMPLISVILLLVFVPKFGVKGGVWSYVIAAWITLSLSSLFWFKHTPQLVREGGGFNIQTLLKSSLPLFCVSLAQFTMVWSSSLMLGAFGTEQDVGIFNIANKIALLVNFILSCVNTVIAPQFAEMYQKRDIENIQTITVKATILMVATAAPIAMIIIIFPQMVMSIFGKSFVHGSPVLVVLALGQFLYVATGAVGYLLTMSGHENVMKRVMIFCTVLIVSLNFILIPPFGALGAAIATSITLVVQNLIISFVVWKIIGVVAIPYFGKYLTKLR